MSSLKITQVRSTVGQTYRHEGTLRALGLGKIGRSVEREDSPELRGMLRHVNHLVRIEGKDGSSG
jgi:large subunit ribosomal protein L30